MENIENADNLTIETIYKMVLEMKSKLDFLESETHVQQSDKAGLYMESIDLRLSNVDADIVEMKAEMVVMKADIAEMKTEIAVMKAEIESMKLRLSKVETDIAEIRKGIADIKAEQSKFRDNIYKWGLALAANIIVSVSSIVSLVVIFAN